MYYMYLLQSKKDSSLYIGTTDDLQRRFKEHNTGRSLSTRNLLPWNLVYYEAYTTLALARQREHQLKRFAKSYSMLKKRIGL